MPENIKRILFIGVVALVAYAIAMRVDAIRNLILPPAAPQA